MGTGGHERLASLISFGNGLGHTKDLCIPCHCAPEKPRQGCYKALGVQPRGDNGPLPRPLSCTRLGIIVAGGFLSAPVLACTTAQPPSHSGQSLLCWVSRTSPSLSFKGWLRYHPHPGLSGILGPGLTNRQPIFSAMPSPPQPPSSSLQLPKFFWVSPVLATLAWVSQGIQVSGLAQEALPFLVWAVMRPQ